MIINFSPNPLTSMSGSSRGQLLLDAAMHAAANKGLCAAKSGLLLKAQILLVFHNVQLLCICVHIVSYMPISFQFSLLCFFCP